MKQCGKIFLLGNRDEREDLFSLIPDGYDVIVPGCVPKAVTAQNLCEADFYLVPLYSKSQKGDDFKVEILPRAWGIQNATKILEHYPLSRVIVYAMHDKSHHQDGINKTFPTEDVYYYFLKENGKPAKQRGKILENLLKK